MTYKQKALKAWKKLENKYRNVTKDNYTEFFSPTYCPLCDIYLNAKDTCIGCPMAAKKRELRDGCTKFKTFKDAEFAMSTFYFDRIFLEELKKIFSKRADFFKKYYPILEKLPAKKFTPSGWTYFKELDRED